MGEVMESTCRNAMIVAIIAGILLLIAGVNGVATWETFGNFVVENISDSEIIQIVFAILIFLASLGGISVIIGGFLIGKEKLGTGRFLTLLGVGMGIIGLIISIFYAYTEGGLDIWSFFSVGFIGIVLSIVARRMAKK